jgi:hypothetical protein
MQCARSITETNFCGTRIYRRFAFLKETLRPSSVVASTGVASIYPLGSADMSRFETLPHGGDH